MKIGITEQGDAGLDYGWASRMGSVDGAILITKCLSEKFIQTVLPYKGKTIVHVTCTGYGGTILEPKVPISSVQLGYAQKLKESGFPIQNIVIRVDPIIPTEKGLMVAESVFTEAYKLGFRRFRISMIDMYNHVRKRFRAAGVPTPYGEEVMPDKDSISRTNNMLKRLKAVMPDIRIETCAEPALTQAFYCGCVSEFDLELLHLNWDEDEPAHYQRVGCLCIAPKTELLTIKRQCPNQCLYCYWANI